MGAQSINWSILPLRVLRVTKLSARLKPTINNLMNKRTIISLSHARCHFYRAKVSNGDIIIIRYADDSVLGFQYKTDADRFLEELEIRMKKFDLEIHPDKTKLIRFGRFAKAQHQEPGEGKPDTFDFLGFTHYCTKSKKREWFVVGRKTIKKRMRTQLLEIKHALRERLHAPIPEAGVMVKANPHGSLELLRGSRKWCQFKMLFQSCGLVLDSNAKTQKPAPAHDMGAIWTFVETLCPTNSDMS
ncbi:MAG: reverse transcriptase domain-containing protein, partial [Flavobacteriales bacterium]